MSILSRIRQNITLVAIIIFIALIAFVLPDFIKGLTNQVTGPPMAGEVAGETIDYSDYVEEVNQTIQAQGGNLPPEQEAQLRETVWNNMVMRKLYQKEFDALGIEVTNNELTEMFVGRHIDPQYLQAPIFKDSLGNFSPQRVAQWYQFMSEQNQDVLIQEEKRLEFSRSFQKYYSMLQGAFSIPNEAAKNMYKAQNKKVNLGYYAVKYSDVSDTLVTVTESDLNDYISRNAHKYEQENETIIRFSRFNITPSTRDTAKSLRTAFKLKKGFANTVNDSIYTQSRSLRPYSEDFLPLSRVPVEIQDSVQNAEDKSLFGPMLIGGSHKIYKLVATQEAEESTSKLAHILVTYKGDTTAAETKAKEIFRDAKSGDFGEVAQANSDDTRTKLSGGELGWVGKGLFGEKFDEAVAKASVGSVIGPVEGRGGFHVIKVLDRTEKLYDIAEVEDQITYTTATKDSVYGLANQFAGKLRQNKDINATASDMNVVAFESNPLSETTRQIAGSGLKGTDSELRKLILWAVNSAEGDFTQSVERVGDDYVLAQVIKKSPEGTKALEDIRSEVERAVLNEKKGEYILSLIGNAGELSAMQTAMGGKGNIGTADGVGFDDYSVPGLGFEPKVLGAAFGTAEGATSTPIAGLQGVYAVKVTGVVEAADPDVATLATFKQQMEQGFQQRVLDLQNALKDMQGVEDTRAKAEARNFQL
ncbi:MAG: SurA N-terminal domain-containing protein [Bacteroidota bacterium]